MSSNMQKIVFTKRLAEAKSKDDVLNDFLLCCLARFLAKDWGDCSSEDFCYNEQYPDYAMALYLWPKNLKKYKLKSDYEAVLLIKRDGPNLVTCLNPSDV